LTLERKQEVKQLGKENDEMVGEKRIQEENLLKYQFRPKPIPPEVLIPRY